MIFYILTIWLKLASPEHEFKKKIVEDFMNIIVMHLVFPNMFVSREKTFVRLNTVLL